MFVFLNIYNLGTVSPTEVRRISKWPQGQGLFVFIYWCGICASMRIWCASDAHRCASAKIGAWPTLIATLHCFTMLWSLGLIVCSQSLCYFLSQESHTIQSKSRNKMHPHNKMQFIQLVQLNRQSASFLSSHVDPKVYLAKLWKRCKAFFVTDKIKF